VGSYQNFSKAETIRHQLDRGDIEDFFCRYRHPEGGGQGLEGHRLEEEWCLHFVWLRLLGNSTVVRLAIWD